MLNSYMYLFRLPILDPSYIYVDCLVVAVVAVLSCSEFLPVAAVCVDHPTDERNNTTPKETNYRYNKDHCLRTTTQPILHINDEWFATTDVTIGST
jgi:hypothetical protein